jgi:phytanoyl-CoA hydroxylase
MSEALLTDDLRSVLDTHGYVVVDDAIPLEVLDRMLDALAFRAAVYGQEVERAGGPRSYASQELSQQLINVVKSGETWPGQALDISLPKGNIAPDTPMFLEPEAFDLLTEPSLLDVIERFIGPEIWLSPVGHTRLKVPHEIAPADNTRLGTIGWHQDNGVLLEEADDVEILTVWIPLRDATVENGCLCVMPTARGSDLIEHCGGGLSIPESNMPPTEPMPMPMRRGGVLLLHSRTLHSALANMSSNEVRISMDLRYQPVESPTGRPQFPCFLVRGEEEAGRPVTTWEEWRAGWLDARDRLANKDAGMFNRWSRVEGCA